MGMVSKILSSVFIVGVFALLLMNLRTIFAKTIDDSSELQSHLIPSIVVTEDIQPTSVSELNPTAEETYVSTESTQTKTSEEPSTEVDTEIETEANDTDYEIVSVLPIIPVEIYNYQMDEVKLIETPSILNVLVNKLNELPESYVPENLVIPNIRFSFSGENPKKYMVEAAAVSLEKMLYEAEKNGFIIYGVSGYRSFEKQKSLFTSYANQYGETAANKFSAHPGMSEHQTGLAMDVSCESVGFDLVTSFGDTNEGKWLAAHAHEFGFILRYPSDKTEITGYMYEPWHFRFVGKDLASEIHTTGLTLEEYYREHQ